MTGGILRRAALVALGVPRDWPVGLAGFLARGGIVPFALPILVLPSVVGLTTFVEPTSISAAGLSPRLIVLIGVSVGLLSVWLVLGSLVGVACERVLVGAVLPTDDRLGVIDPGLARLLAVRLVSLIPFLAALAIGGVRLEQVAYQELILPSDAVRPVVARVLADAPEVVALLAAGWLVSESIGAIAVRLIVLGGSSPGDAVVRAALWVARHPVRWLVVTLGTTVGSVVVVGSAIVVAMTLWSLVRTTLLGAGDPVAIVLATVSFVAVWTAGLALAAVSAVWRSTALSLAVVGDHRGGGPVTVGGGTL